MDKNKPATDIDRKLAIYYHPLFQEVIKNILLLFNIPQTQPFEIGLIQFIEFNLKLQKSLLPTFEMQNALVSALNDWVKQVAECLSYEGMVSTAKCEQITSDNFKLLLQKELSSVYIKVLSQREEYIRMMVRMGTHDAFKLLGVKINKEVFNKFMFDLCSTWCEFLDIELFSYFLIAIYIQISEGESLTKSQFRNTEKISTIDLEFMEEFEEIKAQYSKNRKKDLRYYRAWCEWNYLRINEVGEALILQLDQVHENDQRILELALIFEKAIQVINEQITNQNVREEVVGNTQPFQAVKSQEERDGDFLIARKIGGSQEREKKTPSNDMPKQTSEQTYDESDQTAHNFQIQIDADGNMYLKKIVKLPIFGTKIQLQPHERKLVAKMRYIQQKKEEIRHISNLYRRMEHMKVRLQHNIRIDPYSNKEIPKINERDQFYSKQETAKQPIKNQYTNMPVDKIIHSKVPLPQEAPVSKQKVDYHSLFKPELMEQKEPIRNNQDYIHKVMAPSFLTDKRNNISYAKGEAHIYGVGPFSEKRDLKIGLPKIKDMQTELQPAPSYHLVGKLTRDRGVVNERVKSFSNTQTALSRVQKQREQFKHVWNRYISQEQMSELNNYQDFYRKLSQAKKLFSKDYQSQYRVNLKQILLYQNKRYEMGGVIDRKQEEKFYERIRKLIRRDQKRQLRKRRRNKLRDYRRAVKGKSNKRLFEDIFINYHRSAIRSIKQDRSHASMIK